MARNAFSVGINAADCFGLRADITVRRIVIVFSPPFVSTTAFATGDEQSGIHPFQIQERQAPASPIKRNKSTNELDNGIFIPLSGATVKYCASRKSRKMQI